MGWLSINLWNHWLCISFSHFSILAMCAGIPLCCVDWKCNGRKTMATTTIRTSTNRTIAILEISKIRITKTHTEIEAKKNWANLGYSDWDKIPFLSVRFVCYGDWWLDRHTRTQLTASALFGVDFTSIYQAILESNRVSIFLSLISIVRRGTHVSQLKTILIILTHPEHSSYRCVQIINVLFVC